MQVSAEVRWFWKSEPPPELNGWFCGKAIHGFPAGGVEERTDVYLSDANQVQLGIKLRGQKEGVEVKGLVSVIESKLAEDPFVGGIEIWAKWTSEQLKLPDDSVLSTAKRRRLRKFDASGPSPREIALDTDGKPLGQQLPVRGCNVEVTEITLLDRGEVWWTFGLESFGSLSTVEGDLRMVAKELASREPPNLDGGLVASYPAWLVGRIKETPKAH